MPLDSAPEEILEADLPICDPHHHLWDFPDSRYLLDKLLADIGPGADVDGVLKAHIAAGGGRFRGIRHAAGRDASPVIRHSHTDPPAHLYLDPRFG